MKKNLIYFQNEKDYKQYFLEYIMNGNDLTLILARGTNESYGNRNWNRMLKNYKIQIEKDKWFILLHVLYERKKSDDEYRKRNKEKLKEYRSTEEYKQKKKEERRKYYLEHKDKIKEQSRNNYRKNKKINK